MSKHVDQVSWENDGEFFRVQRKRDDGQVVVAIFRLTGGVMPPREKLDEILANIRGGARVGPCDLRWQPNCLLEDFFIYYDS
jgi:hypothetical protein